MSREMATHVETVLADFLAVPVAPLQVELGDTGSAAAYALQQLGPTEPGYGGGEPVARDVGLTVTVGAGSYGALLDLMNALEGLPRHEELFGSWQAGGPPVAMRIFEAVDGGEGPHEVDEDGIYTAARSFTLSVAQAGG